jgi:transposase
MAQQMTFAAVARLVTESWHRVHAICSRYVDLAVAEADLSKVATVAIDETACRGPSAHGLDPWGGHDYLTIAADARERKVVFVIKGRNATTIARFAEHLATQKARSEQITTVSIDMSPAFIRGVADHLPKARITFDKFHVIAHASAALDQTRRLDQRADPSLKGLRWALLKDRQRLSAEARADLDALISQAATKRTARAWLYREGLRAILDRKQINVVATMLKRWCTNVLRSKVAPMKDVAHMIRRRFDGIVAWTQTRQTNGFIEALNGLFQAAKRKARGYTRFATMRTVLFLIAGKLDFTRINPHAVELSSPHQIQKRLQEGRCQRWVIL